MSSSPLPFLVLVAEKKVGLIWIRSPVQFAVAVLSTHNSSIDRRLADQNTTTTMARSFLTSESLVCSAHINHHVQHDVPRSFISHLPSIVPTKVLLFPELRWRMDLEYRPRIERGSCTR